MWNYSELIIFHRLHVKSFQAEIEDLHGEFELDRLDYLETIRKQDQVRNYLSISIIDHFPSQALKLHTALLEKVAPLIRKVISYRTFPPSLPVPPPPLPSVPSLFSSSSSNSFIHSVSPTTTVLFLPFVWMSIQSSSSSSIFPLSFQDCNFANLDKVKRDAVWNDDEGRWILPEVAITRTTLPGMNGIHSLHLSSLNFILLLRYNWTWSGYQSCHLQSYFFCLWGWRIETTEGEFTLV